MTFARRIACAAIGLVLAAASAHGLDRESRLQDVPMAVTVFDRVNLERVEAGCSALKIDDLLTTAARKHSEDMALARFVGHIGSNGSTVGKRANADGYYFILIGENISDGDASAEDIVDAWMASMRHRENILNCRYEDTGVWVTPARNGKGLYWVQVFGVPYRR
jgi:uncharacterized protein YkwD